MKRGMKFVVVLIPILLIISLSMNIVSALNQGAEPGSDQDPIVSKSYVDAAVSQLTSKIQLLLEQNEALKNQNSQLSAKLTAQEQTIKTLQTEVNSLKTGVASSVSTGNGTAPSAGKPAAGGTTGGTTAPAAGTATTPAAIGKGTVNTAVLNLRSKANTTSSIVVKLLKNETVTVVSKSGDWYKITTSKGKSGYVMAKFITIKK